MKQDKTIKVPVNKVNMVLKSKHKDDNVYYNIIVTIEGMTICLEPKFLNFKQSLLLKHKLARLMGDEKNEK